MPRRNAVKIDEMLCNGCGKCIVSCAEGAITIVDGKEKVLREELCDGLGFCVGICPTGALSVEEKKVGFKGSGPRLTRTGWRILGWNAHLKISAESSKAL